MGISRGRTESSGAEKVRERIRQLQSRFHTLGLQALRVVRPVSEDRLY